MWKTTTSPLRNKDPNSGCVYPGSKTTPKCSGRELSENGDPQYRRICYCSTS